MAKAKKAKKPAVVDPSELIAANEEKLKFYAKWAMILVALAIVFSFLIGYFNERSDNQAQESAKAISAFEKSTVKEFNDGKIQAADFISKSSEMLSSVDSSSAFLPIISSVFDKLKVDSGIKTQFTDLLSKLRDKSGHPLSSFYYNLYTSIHHEEHGEYTKAIEFLKKNHDSAYKLEEKNYLDLGRLYLLNNDKDQAKSNFQHLVKNFPDSKEANLAKIYANKNGITLE